MLFRVDIFSALLYTHSSHAVENTLLLSLPLEIEKAVSRVPLNSECSKKYFTQLTIRAEARVYLLFRSSVPMPQLQKWSDFNAANLLPNSVYLWGCNKSQPGDGRPSRSDAVVAWIVIIMRAQWWHGVSKQRIIGNCRQLKPHALQSV